MNRSGLTAKDRIIVALDVPRIEQALQIAGELRDQIVLFKIGLELINGEGGPQAIKALNGLGVRVFYDIKLHDIPNTVAGAARTISRNGVAMFNVHASGGVEMMEAAVANKGDSLVLAVTLLTSFNQEMAQDYYQRDVWNTVGFLATRACSANVDGLICSPADLDFLRGAHIGEDLLKVTPGVRPEWAAVDDQKRVMTPGEAIKAGAHYLVIGRPITSPPGGMSRTEATKRIVVEVEEALAAV